MSVKSECDIIVAEFKANQICLDSALEKLDAIEATGQELDYVWAVKDHIDPKPPCIQCEKSPCVCLNGDDSEPM